MYIWFGRVAYRVVQLHQERGYRDRGVLQPESQQRLRLEHGDGAQELHLHDQTEEASGIPWILPAELAAEALHHQLRLRPKL